MIIQLRLQVVNPKVVELQIQETMTIARTTLTIILLLIAAAIVAPVLGLDPALVGPLQALAAMAAILGVPALLVALQGPVDQEVQELEALVRQAVQAEAQADQKEVQEQQVTQAQVKAKVEEDLSHQVELQKAVPQKEH